MTAEIILALDCPDGDTALRLLDRLPELRWVKVGSILFAREGPALVRELGARGLRVFLDLKWHDIPNTVAGAVQAAGALGVAMATVHTLGGERMLREAVRAAGDGLSLVGVTVLTSHDAESYARAAGREHVVLLNEVVRLAGVAAEAGLHGVVCSPQEIGPVRRRLGSSGLVVVPGIRRPGDRVEDQRRTASPREAAEAGATHLVVGRPILQAADPAVAYREILESLG
ncbi:MAG TPA: orotidine-5'-phosphate decarboxylase [Gemmatimonadales bacterium]|nr:orotidine-5'-phosphate decarboxylase [Gemmatimonadales bacterium]